MQPHAAAAGAIATGLGMLFFMVTLGIALFIAWIIS